MEERNKNNLTDSEKEAIRESDPKTMNEIEHSFRKLAVEKMIAELKEFNFTVSEAKDVLDWTKERIESETVVKD